MGSLRSSAQMMPDHLVHDLVGDALALTRLERKPPGPPAGEQRSALLNLEQVQVAVAQDGQLRAVG